MKNLITLLLLLIPSISYAEFAKIVDADGYVNVRKGAGLDSRIVGRISSGEFVYILEDEIGSPWIFGLPNANNNENKDEPLGYIHKSRIKRITQGNEGIKRIPVTHIDKTQSTIQFSDDNVSVLIQTEVFDYPANAHNFTKVYPPEGNGKYFLLTKYKDKIFWGTDGTEPLNSKQFKSITIKTGNRLIEVPNSEFENLFNVGFYYTDVYFDPKTDSIYIEGLESDGAGSYAVLFAIEQGQYVGKTIVRPF